MCVCVYFSFSLLCSTLFYKLSLCLCRWRTRTCCRGLTNNELTTQREGQRGAECAVQGYFASTTLAAVTQPPSLSVCLRPLPCGSRLARCYVVCFICELGVSSFYQPFLFVEKNNILFCPSSFPFHLPRFESRRRVCLCADASLSLSTSACVHLYPWPVFLFSHFCPLPLTSLLTLLLSCLRGPPPPT